MRAAGNEFERWFRRRPTPPLSLHGRIADARSAFEPLPRRNSPLEACTSAEGSCPSAARCLRAEVVERGQSALRSDFEDGSCRGRCRCRHCRLPIEVAVGTLDQRVGDRNRLGTRPAAAKVVEGGQAESGDKFENSAVASVNGCQL